MFRWKSFVSKIQEEKYKNPLRKYRYKKIVNYSIDGVLLPKDVKYAVNIIDADGKMIRNYINKYGIFKEPIAGYTAVEREIVDNIHEVARNLKGILGEQYSVQLEDISFSSTDDSTREIK